MVNSSTNVLRIIILLLSGALPYSLAGDAKSEDLAAIRQALEVFKDLPDLAFSYSVDTKFPDAPSQAELRSSLRTVSEGISGNRFFHEEVMTWEGNKPLGIVTSFDGERFYHINRRTNVMTIGKNSKDFPTQTFDISPLTILYGFLNENLDIEKTINDFAFLRQQSSIDLALSRCKEVSSERNLDETIGYSVKFVYDNKKQFDVSFNSIDGQIVPVSWKSVGVKNAEQTLDASEFKRVKLEGGKFFLIPTKLTYRVTSGKKILMIRQIQITKDSISVSRLPAEAFVPSAAFVDDIVDTDLNVRIKY